MGVKEDHQPLLPLQTLLADSAESAPVPVIPGCAESAIARGVMPFIHSSQVNVVSLKSDNEGRDRGAIAEHGHGNLAASLLTRSQPPGLQ